MISMLFRDLKECISSNHSEAELPPHQLYSVVIFLHQLYCRVSQGPVPPSLGVQEVAVLADFGDAFPLGIVLLPEDVEIGVDPVVGDWLALQ